MSSQIHISIKVAAVLLGVTEDEARALHGLSKVTCSLPARPAAVEQRMVLEEVMAHKAKSRGVRSADTSLQEKMRAAGTDLSKPHAMNRNTQ